MYKGVGSSEGVGRFVLNGKVSKSDANALMKYLREKELFAGTLEGYKNGSKIKEVRDVEASSQVQKAIAEFFNSRFKPASVEP